MNAYEHRKNRATQEWNAPHKTGRQLAQSIENAAVILQSCNYVAVSHNEYRITSINYTQLVWQLYRNYTAACATPHHCTAVI